MPHSDSTSSLSWSDDTDSYWSDGVDTGAQTGADAAASLDSNGGGGGDLGPKVTYNEAKLGTLESATKTYGKEAGKQAYYEYWGDKGGSAQATYEAMQAEKQAAQEESASPAVSKPLAEGPVKEPLKEKVFASESGELQPWQVEQMVRGGIVTEAELQKGKVFVREQQGLGAPAPGEGQAGFAREQEKAFAEAPELTDEDRLRLEAEIMSKLPKSSPMKEALIRAGILTRDVETFKPVSGTRTSPPSKLLEKRVPASGTALEPTYMARLRRQRERIFRRFEKRYPYVTETVSPGVMEEREEHLREATTGGEPLKEEIKELGRFLENPFRDFPEPVEKFGKAAMLGLPLGYGAGLTLSKLALRAPKAGLAATRGVRALGYGSIGIEGLQLAREPRAERLVETAGALLGFSYGFSKGAKKLAGIAGLEAGKKNLSPRELKLYEKYLGEIKEYGGIRAPIKPVKLREVERVPGKAVPVIEKHLRETGDILGGSVAQKTQVFVKTPKPHDVDVFSTQPRQSGEKLVKQLREAGIRDVRAKYKPERTKTKIDKKTGKEKKTKTHEAYEISFGKGGGKAVELHNVKWMEEFAYTRRIVADPTGIRILDIREQAMRKLVGAYVAKRGKDVPHLRAVLRSLQRTKELQEQRLVSEPAFSEPLRMPSRKGARTRPGGMRGRAARPPRQRSIEKELERRRGVLDEAVSRTPGKASRKSMSTEDVGARTVKPVEELQDFLSTMGGSRPSYYRMPGARQALFSGKYPYFDTLRMRTGYRGYGRPIGLKGYPSYNPLEKLYQYYPKDRKPYQPYKQGRKITQHYPNRGSPRKYPYDPYRGRYNPYDPLGPSYPPYPPTRNPPHTPPPGKDKGGGKRGGGRVRIRLPKLGRKRGMVTYSPSPPVDALERYRFSILGFENKLKRIKKKIYTGLEMRGL